MARTEKQRKADAQEKRWADLTNGSVRKGSGSGWRLPQDVLSGNFLWSCKGTDAASMSIKRDWWEDVRESAAQEGIRPGMHLEIRGGGRTRRLVVIDEDAFLEFIGT